MRHHLRVTTPAMNPQRELRFGRDYPVWPYLKWGHALRLHQKLANDFSLWRGSLATETRTEYSEDRRVATFYAAIRNPPPTYEWSLALGDIVHNYRSALDALAWSMAHLDGSTPDPQDEKQIYFPLTRTRGEFDKLARGRLKSVPAFVLERLESVQPYHGGQPENAIGVILHDLDIEDKHRASIELSTIAADRTTYQQMWRYEDPNVMPDPETVEYEWLAGDGPVTDGDPVAVLRFAKRVAEAEIIELPLVLRVEHAGRYHDLFAILQMIEHQVGATFRRIERGFLPDDDQQPGMSASAAVAPS